jgi:hypothetical protein
MPLSSLTTWPFLLADRAETLRELGSGFRGEQAKVSVEEILVAVAAVAVLLVMFWLLSRWLLRRERRGVYHDANELFRKLATAHSLDYGERRLLLQLARCASLPLAACLFLRPDLFDNAISYPDVAPRADELRAIKVRLFSRDGG